MVRRICTYSLLMVCGLFGFTLARADAAPAPSRFTVFIGTRENGIFAYRLDSGTEKVESIGEAAEIERPTWLALNPHLPVLYAVSEVGNDGKSDGSLFSYKFDAASGKLELLNKVSATGGGTTHLALDKTGRFLLAVNFGGGQVVAFRLNADGSIGEQTARVQHTGSGPNRERQDSAHPHQINFSADNRYVLVPDRSLDKIFTYKFDAKSGALTPGTPAATALPLGSAPRHFTFHPSGRFGYVITELEATIIVYDYVAATGELKPIQTVSTVPENFTGTKSGAEVWAEPSGRFLYAASRSDETILAYSIDPNRGTLSFVQRISCEGKTPRYMVGDPTGKFMFVMNEKSNQVVIFKIDGATGKLSPTGQKLDIVAPAHVVFVPAA